MDASVLINLIHGKCLDLLAKLEGYVFYVPEEVRHEVRRAEQFERLEAAISKAHVEPIRIESVGELETFVELRRTLGSGESACLALAQHRGWMVACDEKRRFLRLAMERLGPNRVIDTPGVLLLAIRRRRLSIQDADEIKVLLESRRFRMPFESFRELLP